MKIKGLYINGFGHFHDLNIKELSSGLTLFSGKNESGKSSLLAFIRAILFGFPNRRSKENLYPPLAGGNHGGNLGISLDNNEQYIVERYPGPRGGRVEVSGTKGTSQMLSRLLSINDSSLFNNIYAFGLSELQNFETLNNDTVGEALYSAGAGLNPQALADLKTFLDKREDDLFKPRGSKTKINRVLSRIAEINKEKKTLSFNLDEYDSTMDNILQLDRDIKTIETEKVHLAIQIKKLEQQSDIFPLWVDLTMLRQRLNKVEKVDSFPMDGIARYDNLKNRLFEITGEYQDKKDSIAGIESKLSGLKGLGLIEKADKIKNVAQNKGYFDSLEREISSINQEISAAEGRLREKIKGLGSGWNEKRVCDFNLSIATGEEVRGFRDTINNRSQEVRSFKDLLDKTLAEKKESEAALSSLPAPEIKDVNLIKELKVVLRSLKVIHHEGLLLEKDLSHVSERLAEFYDEKKDIVDKLTAKTFFLPLWPSILSIAAGLSVVWLFYYHNRNIENAAGMAFFFISGLILWFIHHGMFKTKNRRKEELDIALLKIEVKIDRHEKSAEETGLKGDNIQETITSARTKLLLEKEITEERLEAKGDELLEQESLFKKQQEIKESIARIERQYVEAEKIYSDTLHQRDELIISWQEWLCDHNLDSMLSPDSAIETLDIIRNSVEAISLLQQLRQKRESFEKQKKDFCEQVNRVLAECGREAAPDDRIPQTISTLLEDFEKDEQISREREILNNKLGQDKAVFEKLSQQISAIGGEIRELFKAAKADNEKQYRQRGKCFEERQIFIKDIEIQTTNIRRLAGTSENVDEIIKEISHIDLSELEGEMARVEAAFKDRELLLETRKKEHAQLEERVRVMVKDDQLSKLRAEEENLKQELEAFSEEWITARFAKGLLSRSMARFEKERQPGVISEAGEFLKSMTLGRYSTIVAPLGENRIEVVDNANNRKTIDQLSRGTAEQLYLALRFGFIKEFSKRAEPMPIIMDEILVNFDRERAKATIRGITELSQSQQVFYFTCHPYVVDMFLEADSNIPVLEISEGKIIKN